MHKNENTENTEETYEGILGDYQETEDDALTPSENTDENGESSENTPKKGSGKKVLSIVGITAASAALVGCLTFAGVGLYKRSTADIVTRTPHYVVDNKVLACYYHETIELFISYYGEEALASNYGMDVTKPLKEQAYPYDTSMTWYDVIMDQAKSSMSQQLVVCEAARADGYVLPEEDKADIEETIAQRNIDDYGNDVTVEDLRTMLEMQAYSTSYYNYYMDSMEFTDEEINAYYEADKASFETCGMAGFSISFDTGEETATGDDAPDLMSKEEAEKKANDLKSSKTAEEFEDKVAKILVQYEGYSKDELDSILPSIYNEAYGYSAGSELSEWAFGGAAAGDTYMIEGQTAYYVYMMTSSPARNETATVNVRHILFMNQEDNMQAAEDALDEWKNGEATEESFAALAEKYSEDGGSNTNGGLYENVIPGQMTQAFNDWCFDSSRKPGDTDIVETDFGCHVMYFCSAGDPVWKNSIISNLQQQKYSSWYAGLLEEYPVNIRDEAVDMLEG